MKTTLQIVPVSLTDGNINKWQAQVLFTNNSKDNPLRKSISGAPMRSKAAAMDALKEEIKAWSERLELAKKEIEKFEKI